MGGGHVWNGWLRGYDETGKLIYGRFVTDGMHDVAVHAYICDEYDDKEKEQAKRILQLIIKEIGRDN